MVNRMIFDHFELLMIRAMNFLCLESTANLLMNFWTPGQQPFGLMTKRQVHFPWIDVRQLRVNRLLEERFFNVGYLIYQPISRWIKLIN